MPVTSIRPLLSSGAVARVTKYLADGKAPSHQEYSIVARIGCAEPEVFVASVARGVELLNAERNGSHVIRVHAWWVIVRYADQSFLTEGEMAKIESGVLAGIPVRESAPVSWHNNRLTGASDLNVIVPSIADGPVAQLRRFVGSSLRQRVVEIVDAITEAVNALRLAAGEALIRTVAYARAESRKTSSHPSLEMQLAVAAARHSIAINFESLPTLLRYSGYEDDDFWVRDDVLEIRRGKKRRKFLIDGLIVTTRSILGDTQISQTLESRVLPTKASTADVRQFKVQPPPSDEKVSNLHQPAHR